MRKTEELIKQLSGGAFDERLSYIYSCGDDTKKYADRFLRVIDGYRDIYGSADELALFSAPGRTEIGGNHTDHQHGCVLAGSVDLDVIAAAAYNGENVVRIKSKGYDMDVIDLDDLEIHPEQFDKAIALIRGVLRRFRDRGCELRGFNAYTESNVLKGSGLSSSAAFEVLVGTIVNTLCADGEAEPVEIAKIGQYAENVFYDKPSGLLDQMASSVGAVVAADFGCGDDPKISKVEFDLNKYGYSLCIVDSGADHADLTGEYASIPSEMKQVAEYFGKSVLREVDEAEFLKNIRPLREKLGNDRAVLRAYHFFKESQRACLETEAIRNGEFERFLELVKLSGRSSYMYLQNVFAASMPEQQAVAVALAMCEEILGGRGAYRVHGGGFAGTVQAFVPNDMLDEFKTKIEAVLGEGMCHVLSIRPIGGCCISE